MCVYIHMRAGRQVWLKPAIIKSLEARRNAWFVYWPHFEVWGLQQLNVTN